MMKMPRYSTMACAVIAGASMVFAPGGARANAAGFGGAAAVGGSASASGGHGTTVNAGSAHVSTANTSHGAGGLRSGGSLRPITATYGGPPHYLPGGFAPNVPNRGLAAPVANGRVATTPTAVGVVGGPRVTGAPASVARVQNAWSDPPAHGAFNASRSINNTRSGSTLYADSFRNPDGSHFGHGRGNNDYYGRGSRYRYRRGYGNYYGYPGVFIGGYGYDPYFYGDTTGLAEPGGDYATASVNADVGDSNALSPEAQNELSRPYGAEPSYPAAADAGPDTQVTSAAPGDASNRTSSGPDSLVEAVQAELARRGYFGGKIDAVYNDATHAAIKRFQADQNLPASGRVNEATLHALQLD